VRLIPVIDLRGGHAVHARRGERARYEPVRSVLTADASDPVMLARAYRDMLGTNELYVADLDAIHGLAPAAVLSELCRGARVWLDAGTSSADGAHAAAALGACHIVIGLETLVRQQDLEAIVQGIGGERVAFSLDVKDGIPLAPSGAFPPSVTRIARWVVDAGVERLIVLDLGRVGAAMGPNVEFVRAVRDAVNQVELIAGGGVRDAEDLRLLAEAGCEGVLVATALHEGRIGAAEVRHVARI
jgi:phosphoribosylformimino-5-aminoimidazole carboxamide ribotide isomerase